MICDKCGFYYYGDWSIPEIKCPRCKEENTMNCPRCNSDNIRSRASMTQAHSWECVFCGERFGPSKIPTTSSTCLCHGVQMYDMTTAEPVACGKCGNNPGDRRQGAGSQEFAPVDLINHPPHYTSHPSGVECIQIVEHLNFNIGNAIKYLWRAGLKSPDTIADLKKAAWYVNREIQRLDPLRRVHGAIGTQGDDHVDTKATPR